MAVKCVHGLWLDEACESCAATYRLQPLGSGSPMMWDGVGTNTERIEYLRSKIAKATGWGAAVGAMNEELRALERSANARRPVTSRDPVAEAKHRCEQHDRMVGAGINHAARFTNEDRQLLAALVAECERRVKRSGISGMIDERIAHQEAVNNADATISALTAERDEWKGTAEDANEAERRMMTERDALRAEVAETKTTLRSKCHEISEMIDQRLAHQEALNNALASTDALRRENQELLRWQREHDCSAE